MYKRLLSFCFAIVFLLTFEGCKNINTSLNSTSSQTQKEYVIEEAQKYLENKYPDDTFTYVSNTANVMGIRYYEMNFISEKYDEEKFKVYADPKVDKDSDGHIVSRYRGENGFSIFNYYDTYYEFLLREDAEKYFHEEVTKALGEHVIFKFRFSDLFYNAKKMNNIDSLNDYIENEGDFYLICCCTERFEQKKSDIMNFVSNIKDTGIYGYLSYISIKDDTVAVLKEKSYEDIWKESENAFIERKDYHIYGNDKEDEFDIITY